MKFSNKIDISIYDTITISLKVPLVGKYLYIHIYAKNSISTGSTVVVYLCKVKYKEKEKEDRKRKIERIIFSKG